MSIFNRFTYLYSVFRYIMIARPYPRTDLAGAAAESNCTLALACLAVAHPLG